MKTALNLLFLLVSATAISQATDDLPVLDRTIKVTDPFYREDQFYAGITHSVLQQNSDELSQRTISLGTNFGFLRDIPLNKQRTVSVAPGVGLAFYNLRHNFVLTEKNPVVFELDDHPERNVHKLSYVEIPIEIRWRNSKVHSHKFWRIYTGVKYSYLLNSTSKYEGILGDKTIKGTNVFENSNIGVYVSAGFNTWNFYAYYGFKPLYKKDLINSDVKMINVGLIFYIL